MKTYSTLFSLLLASQVLPCAMAPVFAQAADAGATLREDEFDARRLQNDYRMASLYANGMLAYSAQEVTETNKTLADGNQIKSRTTAMRYRDRSGRMRVSYKAADGKERIVIADPIARLAYLIRPDRNDVLRISGAPSPIRASFLAPTRAPEWSKQVNTPLGVKDFGGVNAVGMLTETFYPAGARGSEKEMVETHESWRANDLSESLYRRTYSPRDGERIVRLENLHLGDVPEQLFVPPSGYTVRDIVPETAQAPQ